MEPYYLIVTNHARERWLERIVDPQSYSHLSRCTGCQKCLDLQLRMKEVIERVGKNINREIVKRYRIARMANAEVTDELFLQAVRKLNFEDFDRLQFFRDGKAVFVIKKVDNEQAPLLITVLSQDMIDGLVIQRSSLTEMKNVFKQWKFQNKQRR